jgi:signal transduction histidine kinase
MIKKVRNISRESLIVSGVGYLIYIAIAVRGLIEYPAVRAPLTVLLSAFLVVILSELLLSDAKHRVIHCYLGVQAGIVIALYFVAPGADYWAITLLPANILAMRAFSRRLGFVWVGIYTVVISVMLIYGHGMPDALNYISVYLAAYLLLSSYSLTLKKTEEARSQSQALLKQVRSYANQVQELAVVEERNRLARELHDSVTQTIFSMTLITKSALILQDREPGKVREKLVNLQELSQNALQEMRELISQLRPLSIADDGLYPVLRRHFEGLLKRDNLRVEFRGDDGTQLPIAPGKQQELFRVIQEALNNVVKHAGTKDAAVDLRQTAGGIALEIEDAGEGFDTTLVAPGPAHFGLSSMAERVEELGGSIDVISAPGKGTRVRVAIPVDQVGNKDG